MYKIKVFLLVVGIGIIFLLGGCGRGKETEIITTHTLEDVENILKNNGFSVSPREEKFYEMLGASNGCVVRVNGELVELYIFNTTTKSGVEALQKLKEEGFMGQGFSFHNNIAFKAPEEISRIIKQL